MQNFKDNRTLRNMFHYILGGLALLSVMCCGSRAAAGQSTRVYRGSIGGSHVEMHLTFTGDKTEGTYAYDRVGENLKLTGKLNAQGGLELAEFGANRKQTGKIMCKQKIEELVDPECIWSRTDGTHESMMSLVEQNFAFTGGLRLVPKTIIDRPKGIVVSYPQLAGDKALAAGPEGFNQYMSGWIRKAVKDFEPDLTTHPVYELNYNVLFGSNELLTVEITEYVDNGGAHPNNGYYAMTYDLARNREVKIEDVLKPDSDYKTAIAKYVVADIQRRDNLIEAQDAKKEGRQPRTQDEPIVQMDQLTEISSIGVTPKGLMIYFDFPNVIAVFDRTFVPYAVIKDYLQPNSPAAKFQ